MPAANATTTKLQRIIFIRFCSLRGEGATILGPLCARLKGTGLASRDLPKWPIPSGRSLPALTVRSSENEAVTDSGRAAASAPGCFVAPRDRPDVPDVSGFIGRCVGLVIPGPG